MADLGELIVGLGADVARLHKDVEEAKKILASFAKDAERQANQAKTPVEGLGGAFKGLSSQVQGAAATILSPIRQIQSAFAVISSIGVAIGATTWLKSMAMEALDAEIAFSKLKTQIEGLGIAYGSVVPQVNSAINAVSKYAIVQDEEVAGTLQRLIFASGNFNKSLQHLSITYDFARQRGIAVSDAATLIGKALTGNVELLGRYIPELRNLEVTLGETATETDKAAYAMALLKEKSASAMSQMTEHERQVKEVSKTWSDMKQAIGSVALALGSALAKEADKAATGYSKLWAWLEGTTDLLNPAIDRATEYANTLKAETSAINENASAHAKTAAELAAEIKARNDALAAKKAALKADLENWKSYYATVDELRTKELENQKRLAVELIAVEQQIAKQRDAYAVSEKDLRSKAFGQEEVDKVTKYYNIQTEMESKLREASEMFGESKIRMLEQYQQLAASAVGDAGDADLTTQLTAMTALTQIAEAQKLIAEEQRKIEEAKRAEMVQSIKLTGDLTVEMDRAKASVAGVRDQVSALNIEMSNLKFDIDARQAYQQVLSVKALIDSIPPVTYKTIVYKIEGQGSVRKPITEKIEDVKNMLSSIGNLRPTVVADLSPFSALAPRAAGSAGYRGSEFNSGRVSGGVAGRGGGSANVVMNIPEVKVIVSDGRDPASLARLLARPLKEEMRKLATLQG